MNSDLHKQMVIEANRKSVGVAYLLWLFLGGFGVHRFYAGSTKAGVMQLVLAISVIGWLVLLPWLLLDLALIPGLIREKNMETISMVSGPREQGPVEAARRIETQADRRREAMLEELRSTGYKKERPGPSNLY